MNRGLRRIAVLTGGGDAPGLNAVVRAVAKSAIHRGWEVLGIEDGFEGFFNEGGIRPLSSGHVRGILQMGGSILRCSNRGDPFRYPAEDGSGPADRSDEVVKQVDRLALDALVVIGGDGSLMIGGRLEEKGVPVVGIPKTIDNDVWGTDVTFGFDTASQTVTDAVDRLHSTAASHQRVMVVEVMGRDAGWIAVQGGGSGGGDVLLIPEIPFDMDAVCGKIRERNEGGIGFSIVVVAEGAHPSDGEKTVIVTAEESATGYERLGGVGDRVARIIEQRERVECRSTVLGHVQRGGSPTSRDRFLGTLFGVGAVDLIARGNTGRMVAMKGERLTDVPLTEVAGRARRVEPDGPEVHALEAIGVNFGR
ncbi:MAG TPA: ATP-dependent 6-phosphofructokinase [bacterium]|nr:ATP-dependent 6-phosphofructokinase [bacterium]